MLPSYKYSADLCVVGGGIAGICAAVAAARQGASVVLVQDRPMLGGNASSEIRMWVCGANGTQNRETGIIEEINLESLYRNPYKLYPVWDGILYGKVKAEPNITLLLNASVCDAVMAGNKIKTVVAWQTTTQSWHYIDAKNFADCSGDSILAPLSHAEFRMGREANSEFCEHTSVETADGMTMGLSCLIQAHEENHDVDFTAPEWATKLTDRDLDLRPCELKNSYENFWYLELGGTGDSIADTETVRDDLIKLAYGYWDAVKNSGRFKNASRFQLDFIGFLPGKRESRRMMGPHILTEHDVLSGGHFEDVVAYGGWGLDDHDPRGFYHKGAPNQCEEVKHIYGIPYRCLYSKNIENLFFAGRNISTTHAALSSSRVMMTCALLGQAVGVAAALAAENNITPQGVYDSHIKELQQILMRQDCFLPYFTRKANQKTLNAKISGCENAENLRNGIDRNHELYGQSENGVFFETGDEIKYEFTVPEHLGTAHLVFDSDLDRDTLPGDECERRHTMRCNVLLDSPKTHLPLTLVRDYRLTFTDRNGVESTVTVKDNIRRMNEIKIEKTVITVSLTVLRLWGDSKKVHIFSFDFY